MKWTHKRPKDRARYYSLHPHPKIYCVVEPSGMDYLPQSWFWRVVESSFSVASGRCASKAMAQRIAEEVAELYNDGDVIE